MESMNVLELSKALKDESQLVLLDVRDPWEYDICHIEGSVNISLAEISERNGELCKEDKTVVICHHGMRSAMACEFLISEGFQEIINLDGGIDAWASSIDKEMTRY